VLKDVIKEKNNEYDYQSNLKGVEVVEKNRQKRFIDPVATQTFA